MAGTNLPPKFCPRCGSFYRDMPSATCPQCFAPLEVLGEDDAAQVEMAASNPELAEAKAVEDEKYKEQAFGGCLGVVAIAVLTIIVAAIIIYTGMHRKMAQLPAQPTVSFEHPDSVLPVKLAGQARTSLKVQQKNPSIPFSVLRSSYGPDLDVFAAPANLPPTEHEAFRLLPSMTPGLDTASMKRDEIVTRGADYIVLARSIDQLHRAVNELAQ